MKRIYDEINIATCQEWISISIVSIIDMSIIDVLVHRSKRIVDRIALLYEISIDFWGF